jgi:ferredoxin like protein
MGITPSPGASSRGWPPAGRGRSGKEENVAIDVKEYLRPHVSLTMAERLDLVRRRFADESHIEVDQEAFRNDPDRAVLFVCPAQVFKLNEEAGTCIVNFEDCLECGTCQVARRYTTWRNPKGGFGVTYRYG